VVAATHRDLRVEVNHKRFRADLYYRLNVLRIAVPALRDRTGDIELLAAHFWQTFQPGVALPTSLVQHLAAQSWPGNVRELRNAVERAARVGWTPATPAAPAEQLTYQQAKERAVWAWERSWVEDLITANDGNLSRAARSAKMGRSHLREIAHRHGVAAGASLLDSADAESDPADSE
jgi:two-component system response regulator GlrR